MDFDNSWNALLKPGEATVYFDGLNQEAFQVDATDYSKINAWWLAEFSRLVYRQEADEIKEAFTGPTRQEILNQVGFEEVEFFNKAAKGKGDTQCAILKRVTANAPFAVLVFRGTTNLVDWLTNIRATPDQWPRGGMVHEGFKGALELVWADVKAVLEQPEYINCPLFYTGHSLGAALATLAASLKRPRALYTFGSPLTGDSDFAESLSEVAVYRVVNNRDKVTTVPPARVFHQFGELHYITHDSDMLVDPDDEVVAIDRREGDHLSIFSRGWYEQLTKPPECLADHAPVNYVAHLERFFRQASNA
jgi:predicted lipase